jgi:hypothetical protein
MKDEAIGILLVISVLLFSGCTGTGGTDKTTQAPATTPAEKVLPLSEPIITDADVPLMEENDTVEIGEMI